MAEPFSTGLILGLLQKKTLLHGVPLNRSVVEMICLQHRRISVLQENGEDKKEKETYLDILVRIFVRRW